MESNVYLYSHDRRLVDLVQVLLNSLKSQGADLLIVPCGVFQVQGHHYWKRKSLGKEGEKEA